MNSSVAPVVLITGFGPFRAVAVNPSWQVARALKTHLDWTCPIDLVLEQIQVTYEDVSRRIPRYWTQYNPTLVIHLGVATGIDRIQLERQACNTDYCHADNNGSVPEAGRCVAQDAPAMLSTRLPLDDLCRRVQRQTDVPVRVSEDAGRFLCEFIYYQSLLIDAQRTVFIHVPEANDRWTVEKLAETVQLIIYELLRCVPPRSRLDRHAIPSKNLDQGSF